MFGSGGRTEDDAVDFLDGDRRFVLVALHLELDRLAVVAGVVEGPLAGSRASRLAFLATSTSKAALVVPSNSFQAATSFTSLASCMTEPSSVIGTVGSLAGDERQHRVLPLEFDLRSSAGRCRRSARPGCRCRPGASVRKSSCKVPSIGRGHRLAVDLEGRSPCR